MKLLAAALFSIGLLLAPIAAAMADSTTIGAATAAPVGTGQVVTVQTAPAAPVGSSAPTADQGTTTTTVTTAPPQVHIPWGDWLNAAINQVIVPVLGVVILSLLTYVGAKLTPLLPPWLRGIVNAKNTAALEQLIVPALATGLKQAGTNVAGQNIDITVKDSATASAVDYALQHASAGLVKWAGGPEGIRQKIVARFAMLETGVTAQATSTIAPVTVATAVAAPVVPTPPAP